MSVARFFIASAAVALLCSSPEAGAKNGRATATPVDHTISGNLTLDEAVSFSDEKGLDILAGGAFEEPAPLEFLKKRIGL